MNRKKRLVGIGLVLAVLLVVALCIPAISTSLKRARRITCSNYLKQIGFGIKMYAGEHGEIYPVRLREVSEYMAHQSGPFCCPNSGNEPGTFETVDEWTDYVYVPGLPESVPPETVLMYCPAKNHEGDGGNVLFADGHVEWFNSEIAERDGMESSLEEVIGTIGKRAAW